MTRDMEYRSYRGRFPSHFNVLDKLVINLLTAYRKAKATGRPCTLAVAGMLEGKPNIYTFKIHPTADPPKYPRQWAAKILHELSPDLLWHERLMTQ